MSLKQKTVKGFLWNFLGSMGGGVISFGVTMILARILNPSDFGLLELLIIFTSIAAVFVESGFSRAIIRDKEVSQTDLSTVFYVNLLIGIVIYIILFFAMPFVAEFFDAESLVPLSRVVFLVIISESLALVQSSVLTRQLNFKPYAQASIVAMTAAGGIAVFMAMNGYGIWALAANILLMSVFRTAILWYRGGWKPSFVFSKMSISKYFKFGGSLMIQGVIDSVVSNLETFFIGKVYTKNDLGFFSQARRFDGYIFSKLSNAIQTVTYPSLSKLEGEALKQGYRNVLGVSMFVMIPISFFTFATAENFMVTIFGAKWFPAAEYLRLLAISGLLVPFYSIFINIFLVKGQSGLLLKISIVRQVARVLSIILLIGISIKALLYGIIVVTVIVSVFYVYYGGRLINYTWGEVLRDLSGIITISVVAAGAAYFTGEAMSSFSRIPAFIAQLVTMGVVYMGLNVMTKNRAYTELITITKSLLRK